MTVFQRRNNVSLSTLNQRRNLTLKQRWFWVDSKKLLALTILQCLRTATLNDVCSDVICLQTVVFSWYFMNVPRKWSEEASIFSRLQVYENIDESFSFSITLKDDFCNNVILQIFFPVESCFMEIRVLLPVTLQKELPQVKLLCISRRKTPLRCIETLHLRVRLHVTETNSHPGMKLVSRWKNFCLQVSFILGWNE